MERDPLNSGSKLEEQENKDADRTGMATMKLTNLFLEEEQIEAIKRYGSLSDFIRGAIDLRLAWEQVEDKQCPDLRKLLSDNTARIADLKAHIESCSFCKKRIGEILS